MHSFVHVCVLCLCMYVCVWCVCGVCMSVDIKDRASNTLHCKLKVSTKSRGRCLCYATVQAFEILFFQATVF